MKTWRTVYLFRRKSWKIHNSSCSNRKRSYKNWYKREKSQKPYLTDCNLLIAQDLWQAHYQILLIILLKEIHEIKCKYRHGNKKYETCGIKYKDCDCFLEKSNFRDDFIGYKCLCCNRNYQKNFDESLKKQFFDILIF